MTTQCLKCYGSGFRVVGVVSELSRCRSSTALLQRFSYRLLSAHSVHGAECGNVGVTGQNGEEPQPDASKYEGAYARPSVGKTTGDYVHDAWDLSESSEEDVEDIAPARAGVEHEAEDDEFQVRRPSSF